MLGRKQSKSKEAQDDPAGSNNMSTCGQPEKVTSGQRRPGREGTLRME